MTDKLIAAANQTSWILLYLVAIILARYLWQRCKFRFWNDIFDITLAGAMIEAFSWAMHRQYWWIWRSLRAHGEHDAAAALVNHGYITLIPFIGIWIGAIMLVAPVTHYYFGRFWFPYSASFVCLLFLLSYSVY